MGLFSSSKSSSRPSSYAQGPPPYSANPSTPQKQQNYAPPSPPRSGNPDTRNLPNGWITQLDPSSNRWFYVYTPNATRQWEHPQDRPLNASEAQRSTPNQQPYYPQQQPYYPQQQQQLYPQQQPYYPQQQQQGRMGGMFGGTPGRMGGGGMGMGSALALGAGGGLLGYAVGDALFDHDDQTVINNNYYGDDSGGFDGGGGFDDGGGGFDF
ncbi:hypothetical protein [Absidia glauca]|uniref:WW domain-containing protein n=1 Tax=Absidia glauca TaxID=4829 RepID=A0A163MKA6_ABSGL|nr:hypothetical protein [Absidia glauca]